MKILFPSIVIGVVAAAMTYIGMKIGEKTSNVLAGKAELFGGIVLVLIGLKCYIEM